MIGACKSFNASLRVRKTPGNKTAKADCHFVRPDPVDSQFLEAAVLYAGLRLLFGKFLYEKYLPADFTIAALS